MVMPAAGTFDQSDMDSVLNPNTTDISVAKISVALQPTTQQSNLAYAVQSGLIEQWVYFWNRSGKTDVAD
jgi:hypothetical protein